MIILYDLHEMVARIKYVINSNGIKTATMLNELGYGKNTLSNMEKSKVSCITLAEIADYLGCSTDYLLGRGTSNHILNSTESELLDNYRRLSNDDKVRILEITKAIAGQHSSIETSKQTEIEAARSEDDSGLSKGELSNKELEDLYKVRKVKNHSDI